MTEQGSGSGTGDRRLVWDLDFGIWDFRCGRYPVPSVQLGLPFADDAGASASFDGASPPRVRRLAPPGVSRLAPAINSTIAPASDSSLPPIYFIRHHRARRYLLRVDGDGRVRVTIPRGGSRREADAFARRHLSWIARQRARLAQPLFTPDQRRALRARAEGELPPRLLELAQEHGVRVTRISIRNQRTRWGSCGRDGHICLNWRLVLMPSSVRDYVLVHELMHLRRLDHSPAYWRLVAAACPAYLDARQWLREHGPGLR